MRELGKYGAVFRTNSGTIKLPNGKIFHGLPKGFSDVLFVGNGGRAYFIEAKVKANKPTEAQLKFIEKMQNLGCGAGIAYTVADALKICKLEVPDNMSASNISPLRTLNKEEIKCQ